jgi:regulator of protease activity HflC (stomatin/prohibitin superfamily)
VDPWLIVAIVIAVLVVIVIVRSVKVIPQAQAAVIERLGRFHKTSSAGLVWLAPFLDRVRARIDLREQVVSFPPQPVITEDNLTVSIDTVVYFQVTEPRSAVYEIANYIVAVEQLTTTTLRNVVGGMTLEQTLTSRDQINGQLRGVLDEATGKWGIRVARVELKSIDPPPSIQEAMEKQMRADRDKRAMILTAEGQRESSIKTAEGQKQAAVLSAEGAKQASILQAEGERQSRILKAQGERAARYLQAQGQAKAIEKVFAAVKAGRPTPELLAYQYLQTLPQLAQGDANKVWLIPSEFSSSLEGFAKMLGAKGDDGVFRYEPPPVEEKDENAARVGDLDDDVKDWFGGTTPDEVAQAVKQAEAAASVSVDELPPPGRPSLSAAVSEVAPARPGGDRRAIENPPPATDVTQNLGNAAVPQRQPEPGRHGGGPAYPPPGGWPPAQHPQTGQMPNPEPGQGPGTPPPWYVPPGEQQR